MFYSFSSDVFNRDEIEKIKFLLRDENFQILDDVIYLYTNDTKTYIFSYIIYGATISVSYFSTNLLLRYLEKKLS